MTFIIGFILGIGSAIGFIIFFIISEKRYNRWKMQRKIRKYLRE